MNLNQNYQNKSNHLIAITRMNECIMMRISETTCSIMNNKHNEPLLNDYHGYHSLLYPHTNQPGKSSYRQVVMAKFK